MGVLGLEGSQGPRRLPSQLFKLSRLSSWACKDLRPSEDLLPSPEAFSSSRTGHHPIDRSKFSTSGSYNGRAGEQQCFMASLLILKIKMVKAGEGDT